MRYLLFLSFIVLLSCSDSKQKTEPANHVSKHSKEFNQSMQQVLGDYYKMTTDFVNWDSVAVGNSASNIAKALDDIKLGADSIYSGPIARAKPVLNKDLSSIMQTGASIEQKRRSFNSFTQNFYQLLSDVQYDASKLYLQKCPMAFNDEEPGVWLSEKDTIVNPYMGIHHPRYGSAMIECGDNESTIDFVSADNNEMKKASPDEPNSKDKEEKKHRCR
jgi:hypothetical protein